jgi:preprotein translocase subunit SecG
MTSIFAYFTQDGFDYFFPGAPFVLAALFIVISFGISYKAMGKNLPGKRNKEAIIQ